MDIIRQKGLEYGLEFNEGKLEMICLNGDDRILAADGSRIRCKDSLVYLGAVLSKDGGMSAELGRRIGCVNKAFIELERPWGYASISVTKKL